MKSVIATAAALLFAGCAATPEQIASEQAEAAKDFAEATKGRVAGKPQPCIDTMGIDGPQIVGNNRLIYRQGGKRIFVNELRNECPGLRAIDSIIVTEVYAGQTCRNDRFRVVQRGTTIPGAYCFFGDFVPYDRAE
jgi:PBP1b-binding outer membrane lipoprotein LpoB